MFWRLQNDDRHLMHSLICSLWQTLRVTHGSLSCHWPALSLGSFSLTLRSKPKAPFIPTRIHESCSSCYPHVSPLSTVPSVWNAFPPDIHVAGSMICWMNELIHLECYVHFKKKKKPINIHSIQNFRVYTVVHPSSVFWAPGSDALCLFLYVFITWVLHVCSRKLKKWRWALTEKCSFCLMGHNQEKRKPSPWVFSGSDQDWGAQVISQPWKTRVR